MTENCILTHSSCVEYMIVINTQEDAGFAWSIKRFEKSYDKRSVISRGDHKAGQLLGLNLQNFPLKFHNWNFLCVMGDHLRTPLNPSVPYSCVAQRSSRGTLTLVLQLENLAHKFHNWNFLCIMGIQLRASLNPSVIAVLYEGFQRDLNWASVMPRS